MAHTPLLHNVQPLKRRAHEHNNPTAAAAAVAANGQYHKIACKTAHVWHVEAGSEVVHLHDTHAPREFTHRSVRRSVGRGEFLAYAHTRRLISIKRREMTGECHVCGALQ